MKYISMIILCLGLFASARSQNLIIAGRTEGKNIHSTDYDPDFYASYPGVNKFQLDLDNDGWNDLLFDVHYQINCDEYINWWTSVEFLSKNINIITLAYPETILIRQLYKGDTISRNQSWSEDSISKLYFVIYSKIVSTGQQRVSGTYSDGYVGYRIIHTNDTLYGWINIDATYHAITAKGNAITESTYGFADSQKLTESYQAYPNPCGNKIILLGNSMNHACKSFEVSDICGKKVKSGTISDEKTEINTTELQPGMYFIRLIENDKPITELKFIKQNE